MHRGPSIPSSRARARCTRGSFAGIADSPHGHFAGMGQVVTAVESAPVPRCDADGPPGRAESVRSIDQDPALPLVTGGETRVMVYDGAGRRVREVHRG